jgi:glycosyltransferase involved in cell wall biosynthesis
MTRVLHVITSLNRGAGGPASAVLGMAKSQADAGLNVTLLTGFTQNEEPPRADAIGRATPIRIGPCHGPLARASGMSAQVDRAVANADVVHIHALWEEILHQAARAAQRRGVPYLITPHGMLDRWSLRQSRFKKWLYLAWRARKNLRRAAAFHCTSRTEAQEVDARHLGPPTLVEPLGIDLAEFTSLPPRGQFRAANPKIADKPLIVFLGRIHPGKGVEHLLPAMAQMRNTRAVLAVVGPDSENHLSQMQSLATRLNVADRVLFTGMLKGPARIAALQDADLFALPSDHENFGVAVVEALAAGVPVLISDHVNIRQEIADAGVGVVVPTDPAKIAAALDQWLADDQLRKAAAAKAAPFARRMYDWARIARNWKQHYESIVSDNRPSSPSQAPSQPSPDANA